VRGRVGKDLERCGNGVLEVLCQRLVGAAEEDHGELQSGNSNQAPPECKCRAVPLRTPAQSCLLFPQSERKPNRGQGNGTVRRNSDRLECD
jgi:hypothetical protein